MMMQHLRLTATVSVALFALLAFVAPVYAQNAETKTARPNIVVIVSDDQGWNTPSYKGGYVKTPNVDRIATQGVQLDRFYVSPMCSPTRAGLLTGRYPMRFGMARSVVRPWAEFGLPPEEVTLPEALATGGYAHRGAFGKWHLGHLAPQWHPMSQGFTTFTGMYNGAGDYFTRKRDTETDWHVDAEDVEVEGYTTDLIAGAASAFIAKNAKSGPFLCYVPFSSPHDPLQVPQKYLDQYKDLAEADGKPSEKQRVAAMIACMDDGIGRIMKSLEDTGVADNTIIWFHSDNGGIGKIKGNNAPLRGAKLTVYEGGIRVPSAVWWPGKIEGGRKVETPIVNVDVMPTLLFLAGVEKTGGKEFDGMDVSGALTGATSRNLPARDVYAFNGQQGLEDEQNALIDAEGWKLIVIGPDIRREGGVKAKGLKVELFNLARDPFEKDDLAAQHADIVKRLGEKLVAFRNSEPEDSLDPINRAPRNFQPPPKWHNSYVAPSGEEAAK